MKLREINHPAELKLRRLDHRAKIDRLADEIIRALEADVSPPSAPEAAWYLAASALVYRAQHPRITEEMCERGACAFINANAMEPYDRPEGDDRIRALARAVLQAALNDA